MARNLKLLIALVITITIAAYILLVTIPTQLTSRSYEAARALGEDIRKAFQFTPEVKVQNTIVLNQQRSVFELSVLSQTFQHHYIWQHSWLGSRKKIFITGSFDAKAGFELHRKFTIELRNNSAYVTLPQPVALSVESLGDIIYRDEQGIWNWVDVEDRTRATNAFIRDARRYANKAAFLEDAKEEMDRRIRDLLRPYVDDVIITYETSLPKK